MVNLDEKTLSLLKLQTSMENFDEVVKAREEDAANIKKYAPGRGRIMDIGCGLGICMYLLNDYFDEIHLVDRTEFPKEGPIENYGVKGTVLYSDKRLSGYGSTKNFGFYNDLNFAKDLVKQGNPNSDVYVFDPLELPNLDYQYDMIVSLYSWGFHYPLDEYLDWALEHLKMGGRIMLTLNKKVSYKEIKKHMGRLNFKIILRQFFNSESQCVIIDER